MSEWFQEFNRCRCKQTKNQDNFCAETETLASRSPTLWYFDVKLTLDPEGREGNEQRVKIKATFNPVTFYKRNPSKLNDMKRTKSKIIQTRY